MLSGLPLSTAAEVGTVLGADILRLISVVGGVYSVWGAEGGGAEYNEVVRWVEPRLVLVELGPS